MQNSLAQLNTEMGKEGYPHLETGIDLNADSVIVGNIGSEVRMKYGAVDSAVNSAAREGGFTFRLAITWIDPWDRGILLKWT